MRLLRAAGIGFTFVSARPPKAMQPLAEELELDQPFASFNGAMICSRELEVLSQKLMTHHSSTHASQLIVDNGLDLWAFVGTDWYASEVNGPHTPHHREMVGPPKQMNFSLRSVPPQRRLLECLTIMRKSPPVRRHCEAIRQ